MSADLFSRQIPRLPVLLKRLMRYTERQRAQAMQSAVCNGHHSLAARLARCLLGIQDLIREDRVPITHETLATLLCAHRPSVSVVAKQFQNAGVIRCDAGTLSITDRSGLERSACECYRTVKDWGV